MESQIDGVSIFNKYYYHLSEALHCPVDFIGISYFFPWGKDTFPRHKTSKGSHGYTLRDEPEPEARGRYSSFLERKPILLVDLINPKKNQRKKKKAIWRVLRKFFASSSWFFWFRDLSVIYLVGSWFVIIPPIDNYIEGTTSGLFRFRSPASEHAR